MRRQSDVLRTQHEKDQKIKQDLTSFLQELMSPEELAAAAIMQQKPGERSMAAPPPSPTRTRHNPDRLVDIITFCEHPYFLNLKLTPWQRLIVKAFYSGTHGNQHLEIDDTRTDTCEGCVWQRNSIAEIEHCEALRDRGEDYEFDDENVEPINVKPPYMLAENSPCLECSRFDCELRELRYKNLHEEAINKKQHLEIDQLKSRDIFDQFTTEKDLVYDKQFDEGVRKQMLDKWGNQFQELVLVLGRRSGKSFLVSVIALYEVYKFLMMGHPQARFPIMEHDTITICNVAVSEKQAKEAIFDKIRNLVFSSPFFTPYVGKETTLELHFLTPYDIEANKQRAAAGQTLLTGTIQLMSGHSNSDALVGRTMAVIIIDEMASMARASAEAGTDDDLYSKLKPSLATFGRLGKIICISNPLGPIGKFYSLYRASFDDPTTLMLQLPTWLSNPNIEKSSLASEKIKDPTSFGMQYGAKFGASGSEPFLPSETVDEAFDRGENMRRREVGLPMVRYFAHLDPAYSSDNYSLAVVHTEEIPNEIGPDGKNLMRVIVDHMNIWEPKGKNHPVSVEEVDSYVINLATKFKFAQISYDHWNSQGSIQKLKMHGLNVVMTPFTRQYQDLIFQEFIDLFLSKRIDIYGLNTDDPITGKNIDDVTKARDQLKQLQKHYKGGRPKIEALPGGHDDIPDCLASASYQALKDKVYEQLPRIRAVYLSPRFR